MHRAGLVASRNGVTPPVALDTSTLGGDSVNNILDSDAAPVLIPSQQRNQRRGVGTGSTPARTKPVVLEDLNVSGMLRNKKLARAIPDAGCGGSCGHHWSPGPSSRGGRWWSSTDGFPPVRFPRSVGITTARRSCRLASGSALAADRFTIATATLQKPSSPLAGGEVKRTWSHAEDHRGGSRLWSGNPPDGWSMAMHSVEGIPTLQGGQGGQRPQSAGYRSPADRRPGHGPLKQPGQPVLRGAQP